MPVAGMKQPSLLETASSLTVPTGSEGAEGAVMRGRVPLSQKRIREIIKSIIAAEAYATENAVFSISFFIDIGKVPSKPKVNTFIV